MSLKRKFPNKKEAKKAKLPKLFLTEDPPLPLPLPLPLPEDEDEDEDYVPEEDEHEDEDEDEEEEEDVEKEVEVEKDEVAKLVADKLSIIDYFKDLFGRCYKKNKAKINE